MNLDLLAARSRRSYARSSTPQGFRWGLWMPLRRAACRVVGVWPILLALSPPRAEAQVPLVRGLVISHDGAPLAYAIVEDSAATTSLVTDRSGRFAVRTSGTEVRLRIRQIGHHALTVSLTPRTSGEDTLRLAVIPRLLPEITVQPGASCSQTGFAASGSDGLALLFGDIETGLDRLRLLDSQHPLSVTYEHRRVLLGDGERVLGTKVDTLTISTLRKSPPYQRGAVIARGADGQFMAWRPGLLTLGESAFRAAHCFRFVRTEQSGTISAHRIEVIPADEIRTPDVAATIWLDASTHVLHSAHFRYVNMPKSGRGMHSADLEDTVSYRTDAEFKRPLVAHLIRTQRQIDVEYQPTGEPVRRVTESFRIIGAAPTRNAGSP